MTTRNNTRINAPSLPKTVTAKSVMQRKCACGQLTPGAGACPSCSGRQNAQPLPGGLQIGAPGSRFEREAESVAGRVMRMPESRKPGPAEVLDSPPALQRSISTIAAGVPAASPVAPDLLAGQGHALDRSTRDFMEPRFGRDFSAVRVHTDAGAARSAHAVGARAYTVGQDIVFGSGAYAPATAAGQHLLAHELTHTIQQAGSGRLLQRLVEVHPGATAAADILGQFNSLCADGNFSVDSNNRIQSNCSASSPLCDALCDVTTDPARAYTILVHNVTNNPSSVTLHDGTTETVPMPSEGPRTTDMGNSPTVHMPSTNGSALAFGAFLPDGSPFMYDNSRILIHELCSHARLGHSYAGDKGNRPGHDVTINTENALGGAPARGLFNSPRQGESFHQLPVSSAKKVFKLKDGWHHEHVS